MRHWVKSSFRKTDWRSRNRWTWHMWFPIRDQWWPCLYHARL